MTWFAVPDDLVGGWAVADRQVPCSELDTRGIDPDTARPWPKRDVVICDGCKSQEDARWIVTCLHMGEEAYPANTWEGAERRARQIEHYSVPWPEAKEEA